MIVPIKDLAWNNQPSVQAPNLRHFLWKISVQKKLYLAIRPRRPLVLH